MRNLIKNTITRGAVAALALSAGAATTANAAVTRVSGSDRYATSTKVSDSWPTTPTTAILAAGVGHDVDALTVAPLAKQKNAPIILVDTAATIATIVDQFAKFDTVYIANGTGVVSTNVQAALTAAGKTVIRLGGATRYETALNIAKVFGATSSIVIANGDDDHLVDSLSIASIAAAKGMPIFLSASSSLDSAEATYAKGLAATNAYVLGGTTLVSDDSVTGLGTVTRLAGAGRYETNAKIVTNFKNDAALDYSNLYIASGEDDNLIDSLVAAPLAGLKKAPIVFAHNDINTDVNTLLKGVIDTNTNITAIGGNGAVSDSVLTSIQNIQTTGSGNTSALSVSSVSAISSTSFKVVFNQAPENTSKVKFTVLQGSVPVTVTATWNASNTEATVTSSANLPAATYTVNVKNDATDLGTSSVTVTEQKIAKINITSTKLGVVSAASGFGTGYATYNVLDQYGVDITNSSLANSLTFQSGVGSVSAKDGMLTLTPTINLLQFSTVVITGYDSTSGVSTSATLNTSTQIGTLSDISLSALKNADNKVLTAGDTSSLFYITYTATDISGNPTTDYNTVLNGLILNNNQQLTTSSSNVTATVVADPSDSSKAAIQVQVAKSDSIAMDMPVVITAMTYTGKTSALNVTLKKATAIDSITLQLPAYNIAVGENSVIPFTALDQNGVTLTKYSDIVVSGVSISGAYWYENVDGTASLKAGSADGSGFANDGQQIVTATTPTGKYSSITLNIQKKVVADSLTLDTSVLKPIMQEAQTVAGYSWITADTAGSASQNADFGYDNGGLSVKDQYGRVIDMTTGTATDTGNGQYYVTAVSSAPSVVTASGTATTGKNEITLTAGVAGTATVTFNLYSKDIKKADGTARDITIPVDTKSETFTVVANKDIKDYIIDTVTNPIYADVNAGVAASAVTGRQIDYTANPTVYGTTSSGAKVVLAGKPIIGASVDSTDFVVTSGNGIAASGDVKVAAYKLADATKTGSSTTLVVNVLGADGTVHSVNTAIKSTIANPVATAIAASVATEVTGISVSGDIITLRGDYAALLGGSLAKYNKDGVKIGTQNVYIGATDQYGENSMALSQFVVISLGTNLNGHAFTIDTDGTILSNTVQAGDKVTVSGITNNGLVKTIEIDFK